jgi:hypothetical protein
MKVNCPQVSCALEILKESGNEILEVTQGWSNVKEDLRMKHVLTVELKDRILLKEPDLEYWSYKGSPHNTPDEGFLCKQHSISISFPVEN